MFFLAMCIKGSLLKETAEVNMLELGPLIAKNLAL